jgi:hypothetical protein
MEIKSSAFKESAVRPGKYTCDNIDISPPLKWVRYMSGMQMNQQILRTMQLRPLLWQQPCNEHQLLQSLFQSGRYSVASIIFA